MDADGQMRAKLGEAVAGEDRGLAAADRLCRACVELLGVDGAAVSFMHDGASRGTFGSSGDLSRRLDDYQFTFGEGPCLEAVREGRPVLVPDLRVTTEGRWPAFAEAVLAQGVCAVFALPVTIATRQIGALDMFRHQAGDLTVADLQGGLLAAELAALPLLDLFSADTDWTRAGQGGDGWSALATLGRVEVYQATGMLIDQLGVGATEALARLRAHAFSEGVTASEVAWAIVEGRLRLTPDDGPLNLGELS